MASKKLDKTLVSHGRMLRIEIMVYETFYNLFHLFLGLVNEVFVLSKSKRCALLLGVLNLHNKKDMLFAPQKR